jgi:hypothetical protein
MNQPPRPTSASDSTGRIAWLTTLPANVQFHPCAMFMLDPPLIGRIGHRCPNTISSRKATM